MILSIFDLIENWPLLEVKPIFHGLRMQFSFPHLLLSKKTFLSRAFTFSALMFALLIGSVRAEEPTIDFEKQVLPLLETNCLHCHGSEVRDGGLRFLSRKDLLTLNDSGEPAIVSGHSSESELIKRITAPEEERMPPAEEGDRLQSDKIALLKKWIDAGANWPESLQQQHWAYLKPIKSELPVIPGQFKAKNEIDYFIQQKLSESGTPLEPAKQAEPARLLRRVYLDLTGLPPTPEQVDQFMAEPTEAAYEKIVDELLASPRYGEKWTQQWLDLARYADSNGFQADQLRIMWLYRDWVIKAINDDMPFDQFTIEQLAGDLLPEATWDQKIATGFHRCTTCNVEAGVDPEENRVNQLIDRVNTTGTVWLGTTLECAQCHNHKYDPFTQQDYYSLMAYFNNTPMEVKQKGDSVTFEFYGPKLAQEMAAQEKNAYETLKAKRDALQSKLEHRRDQMRPVQKEWELKTKLELGQKKKLSTLLNDIKSILEFPAEKRSSDQTEKLLQYYESQDEETVSLKKSLESLTNELKEQEPPTSLVMVEQDQMRETFIFKRGDFLSKGNQVTPSTPTSLHPLSSVQSTGNRLEFANWVVSPENPLVARTTVNRWWAHFFGQGLVTTLEDFGTQGEPPTHQRLLDWLAVDLMEQGWSRKHIHKKIVMSATYRQSAKVSPEHLQHDPANKLYSRMSRNRLSAEAIRDNALEISGLLTNKIGGPPVYPPQPEGIWKHVGRNAPKYNTNTNEDRYRRGLYVVWRRSAPYPSFTNFDAPDRASCVVKRSRTNTPLQALTLLNDPAYIEMSWGLANRLASLENLKDDRARLQYGMRLAVSRMPTEEELNRLWNLYQAERKRFKQNPEAATQLLPEAGLKLTALENNKLTAEQMAAWFYIANILLNLDETITKG